jgi:ribonucleoside-diphosphate reductase alpha chain
VQYHLLSASSTLAEEKGACEKFSLTKYSKGILPIDTYKKKIDQVVTRKPSQDWESLRERIIKHGLRNSTVTAQMPVESSSVIQNSTNGIEPVRSLMTYKTSKASTIPVLVPNYATTKNKYTLAFHMENNTGLINVMAAAQKWIDQAISGNLYYNYDNYPDRLLPDSVVIKDLLYAYSMGVKCLYYSNTSDGDKQSASDEKCVGGACTL